MQQICDDLIAEHEALDAVVVAVDDIDRPTPAEGWSVRDTISHLWFFDQRALMALADPDAFAADAERLMAVGIEASVEPGRSMTASDLLGAWRRDRQSLVEAARQVDPATRVPWYGPSMSARSFITARLMETWAHGQDIVDVAPVDRPATDRLSHVAHLGVRARPYSYLVNGRDLPSTDVAVVLEAPSGARWTWGDPAGSEIVRGSAEEFCLVVTQRRHLLDTSLEVIGPAATEWMSIAQAFAGPAGPGRSPLSSG